MKMGFSKNEYSEGVKIHGLNKNFGKFLFFDQKLKKPLAMSKQPRVTLRCVGCRCDVADFCRGKFTSRIDKNNKIM